MKYSQFNSVVRINDSIFLHNTYTDKMMGITAETELIINAAKHEGFDEVGLYKPKFYKALVDNQFLVEDEVDEVQLIKDLQVYIDNDVTSYSLTINPTMNCNFKCWYCYESHVKSSKMDEEIVRRLKSFIIQTIEKNKHLKYFNISWFGGEPLLYFYDIIEPMLRFVSEIQSKTTVTFRTGFTSNGFLITPKMVSILSDFNVGSFQITLDGHEEDHDKVRFVNKSRGSYKAILDNIYLLLSNKVSVRLRINYTHANVDKCYMIIESLKDLSSEQRKSLQISFHRVWQNHGTDDANTSIALRQQIALFNRAKLFAVESELLIDNVKNSCYADKANSAVLNYNGDIFKCTARDFIGKKREGYIDPEGNIIWENNSLEVRLNSKFKNPPCLKCRLLPVCNGGCSQFALEATEKKIEYCVFSYDEKLKDEVVINKCNDILALI